MVKLTIPTDIDLQLGLRVPEPESRNRARVPRPMVADEGVLEVEKERRVVKVHGT
jgi:hypothetical protein